MRLLRLLFLGIVAAFAVTIGLVVTAAMFFVGLLARLFGGSPIANRGSSRSGPASSATRNAASGDVIDVVATDVTPVPSPQESASQKPPPILN